MKILKSNAGPLTNFEVLNFLGSRGALKDPTRVIASIAPSEFKVFDYLDQTVACNQTQESIINFIGKSKKYNLAKAEIINVINIRPAAAVEFTPMIEDWEGRLEGDGIEELTEMVLQVFPSPPTNQMESRVGVEQEWAGNSEVQ